ncbi:MAG: enoyl-CoA hydratase-related protein [Halobacteriales archaeon]|nr:enoyl-CoA hydratase-related protein [Halobacteriales archaeon]
MDTDELDAELDNFRVEKDDGVARLTLDSGKANPLSEPTLNELFEAAVTVNEDDGVRCVVLTGTDGFYCSGFDIGRLEGNKEDGAKLRRAVSTYHDAVLQLHQADKPVVTGINGVAAGGGFGLALLGDVVVMSEDARLEYAYTRIGLTGDGGSTFFLPRLVGLRRATEIALLDRPVEAKEAVEMGIATESVSADEFDDRLDEIARRLADGPTKAYAATKRLMARSFDRSLEEQLGAETEAMAEATHTEDYARGIEAFFDDDEPEFEGR